MPDAMSAGADAAGARAAATLAQLQRVDVGIVTVAAPGDDRLAARQRAGDAAVAAGRGELLEQATAAARELAIQAFSRRSFTGTWAVSEWSISTASAGDRVAVAAAFEEAVTAAVVEDLVDDDTAGILRATADELVMMTGTPEPGSLSSIGLSVRSGPARVVFIGVVALAGFAFASVTGLVVGAGAAAIASELFLRRSRVPGR